MLIRSSLPIALVLAALATACGASTGPADGAASDAPDVTAPDAQDAQDAQDVAPSDAADASTACGTATCTAGQVCVRPCCGGAAPVCQPPLDGGGCPPGTREQPCFGPGGMRFGCAATCEPPPPFCAPRPQNECSGGQRCPVCPSGGGQLTGNEVHCLCA